MNHARSDGERDSLGPSISATSPISSYAPTVRGSFGHSLSASSGTTEGVRWMIEMTGGGRLHQTRLVLSFVVEIGCRGERDSVSSIGSDGDLSRSVLTRFKRANPSSYFEATFLVAGRFMGECANRAHARQLT